MMAARSVNVAVLKLLLRGLANRNDLNGKVEFLIGQGMIAIRGDRVAINLGDFKNHRAIRGLGLKTHADFNLAIRLESAFRDFLDHLLTASSIALFSRNRHLHFVPDLLAREFFFKARNNIAGAVKVLQRLAAIGSVNGFAVGAGQGVVNSDNGVESDRHSSSRMGMLIEMTGRTLTARPERSQLFLLNRQDALLNGPTAIDHDVGSGDEPGIG